MNSLFKSLHKHVWSVLVIVLLSLLLVGCPGTAGGEDKPDDNPSDTSYNLSVRQTYATWVEINFCTVEEMKALRYYDYKLYKGNETEPLVTSLMNDEPSDFYRIVCGNAYSAVALSPDTEYTLKVTYSTPDYHTYERELKFKTKAYDFSDYTLEYDDYYKGVRIKSDEILFGTVVVYRSDKIDGKYQEVKLRKISYSDIDVCDDNNLETNKTYYYKFAVTKYNYNTAEDELLYESAEPKSITLGQLAPKSVDKNSIKVHQGITGVKFEWDAVEDATKYWVSVKPNNSYLSDPNIVGEEVTDTVYEFDALKYIEDFTTYSSIHYRKYDFYITAQNEAGDSNSIYYTFTIDDVEVKSVSVSAGQKEAVYRFKTNFDYVGPGCTVEYILSSELDEDKISDENLIVPVSSSPELTRTDLKTFTEYKSGSDKGYAFVRAKYKDNDGNNITVISTFCSVNNFTTAEFDAVTDLEVLETESNYIKFKFTPLSTEQKDGQDIYYYAFANNVGVNLGKNNLTDYKISDLTPGVNYTLKVFASNQYKYYVSLSDFKDYKNYAEAEAATLSGLSKPSNVVLSEEEGALDTQSLLKVTWDKIAEDDGTGNVAYEVEYKILKKSSFSKFINLDNPLNEEGSSHAFVNTYSATMPVNAGNRYFARVVAYKVTNNTCKVYSDTKEIQFQKYDDRTLVTALTYPSAVGNHAAGDVIDFTDSNVWEGENFVPRSTRETGYNIGMTQFMGAATNERFKLPENNPAYFAFKISFDNEENSEDWGINSTYTPRLIFLDDEAFSLGTNVNTYGRFGRIFIVEPDTNGSILETFGEDQSIFADVNMPWFNVENGKLVSPVGAASAGLPIKETWIYNNSVYIGVKQSNSGDLGFSYFY